VREGGTDEIPFGPKENENSGCGAFQKLRSVLLLIIVLTSYIWPGLVVVKIMFEQLGDLVLQELTMTHDTKRRCLRCQAA
jgi:hypothetical protein